MDRAAVLADATTEGWVTDGRLTERSAPVAMLSFGPKGPNTSRVSVSSSGEQGNNYSYGQTMSRTGRYVAFDSAASLVPGEPNGQVDVFVRDRQNGVTSRISVSIDGEEAGGSEAAISADGRYVAFQSPAPNLVAGDTNNTADVFVRDRRRGTTSRVSVSSAGLQADRDITGPAISANGRYVAMHSYASTLVPGDTNATGDVFVRDRLTGTTTRVSVSSTGAQGDDTSLDPSISGNGRFVAFYSNATNLVAGDTNMATDVFVHDLQTGTTTRESVSSAGAESNGYGSFVPSISASGRYVTFTSIASNLVPGDTNNDLDVFLRDRSTGTTSLVSGSSFLPANASSWDPVITADGRYVAFSSYASNLTPADTNQNLDVFVRDVRTGAMTMVSVSTTGTQANDYSILPAISADGQQIAFSSIASNLVPGDTNEMIDVFVRDLSR